MTAASTSSRAPRWITAVVLGVAGLFYAYAIWNAVAHLVTLSQLGPLNGTGWITLIFGILFPAVVFAICYAIGRGRRLGELALVLLAGLGIVAVFWLSVIGYSVLNLPALVGVAG